MRENEIYMSNFQLDTPDLVWLEHDSWELYSLCNIFIHDKSIQERHQGYPDARPVLESEALRDLRPLKRT